MKEYNYLNKYNSDFDPNIRAIELKFDTIKKVHGGFILIRNKRMVAKVLNTFLSQKTISSLESLAEWEISNGR